MKKRMAANERRWTRIFGMVLCCASLACAQVAAEANKGYKTKEGRDSVARTLDNPNRDKNQKPEEIIALMQIKPGITVADIGTGTGYMLPYLSRAVGPNGKVIGEDIASDFLDRARAKVAEDKLTNAQLVLGTEVDPKLPEGLVDVALALDVYHHFDYPEAMLEHVRDSLLSDGRLVIVEYYKRPGSMPGGDPNRSVQHIRLDQDDLIKEVEANGFRLVSKGELVPKSQHIDVFVKK